MATTSTFPSVETSQVRDSVSPQQTHQLPGVRTYVHAMPTGMGSHSVRRRTTAEAGLALEVLGHAIEYLADEYVHEAGLLSFSFPGDSRVEAIQLLMAANRQVYYACPLMPSIPPWLSLLWVDDEDFARLVEYREILAREVAARRGDSAGTTDSAGTQRKLDLPTRPS
jgi:hypothetical protein